MSEQGHQPYAVMLDLVGRLAVIVGSGPKSLRMSRTLLGHGAEVLVVAPDPPDELVAMEQEGELALERRAYRRGDLDGAFVAFAMSGSRPVDDAVAQEARECGILVNVEGDAASSDFIVPSLVARGALQIAVSTGGAAPQVAREVRREIAAAYGAEWEAYTRLLGEVRELGRGRDHMSEAETAAMIDRIVASGLLARLAQGEQVSAQELLSRYNSEDVL